MRCDLNPRCARLAVFGCSLCRAWYGRPWYWKPVVGSRVLCWAWFQIEAGYAGRDRVLGVIPFKARYADVVPCRCGRRMRVASER